MATTTSLEVAILAGPFYGQPLVNRLKANRSHGRVRFMEFTNRAPSSGTAPAIGDLIVFGQVPPKSVILGHLSRLTWSTGTAACTLSLGDNTLATRHLAATAITTASSATPEAANLVSTMSVTTTSASAVLTAVVGIGAAKVGAVLSGTGITTGTYVVSVDYAARTVTMSATATATSTAVAVTCNGGGYETQDASANAGNSWVSTYDDCTLIGTVAGAQVANNQVITLKVAYVQD